MRSLPSAPIFGALLALAACSAGPPASSPAKGSSMQHVRFDVAAKGNTLEVSVRPGAGFGGALRMDDGMDAFISDMREGDTAVTAKWESSEIAVPACAEDCVIRYRFDLATAAAKMDDPDTAAAHDGAFVTSPSAWLMLPTGAADNATYELHVTHDEATDVALGEAEADGVTTGRLDDLGGTPYAAIGAFRRMPLEDGGAMQLVIIGPEPDLGDAALVEWVHEALLNVRVLHPGYPKNHALVIVHVDRGTGIGGGSAMGNGGSSIQVGFGQAATADQLHTDWVLTHEMLHLSFPGLARIHHWAEEGMATYLEPIVRARRGIYPVESVWKEWFESMPLGQPYLDDQGLDATPTWGRTYWGGALFWFMSDVGVRQATQNAHGIPDLFRRVYEEGDIAVRWPISRLIRVGDTATGVDVVSNLYALHKEKPVRVDLTGMFRDLGVSMKHGEIILDDTAPLASIRKAIVVGPPPDKPAPRL